jgi:hypothetical protein
MASCKRRNLDAPAFEEALFNPTNVTTAEVILREMPEVARRLGLEMQILKASTGREIEEAFTMLR